MTSSATDPESELDVLSPGLVLAVLVAAVSSGTTTTTSSTSFPWLLLSSGMVYPPFPESLDYFFPPARAGGATDFLDAPLADTAGVSGFFTAALATATGAAIFAAAPPAVAVGATGFEAALVGDVG
jgi:hypothetical protein